MLKLAPNLLQLCLTDFCQLKCKHCYFGEYDRQREMSIDEVFTPLSSGLNLSGGEPLMHSKIEKIIKLIAPKFENVKFLSNGISYSKKVCQILKNSSKKLVYQISLDGMKDSHELIRGRNTFDKTVENIKQLKKDFPELFLQISFNSNNINYRDIVSLTKFSKELGADMIFFDRYVPYGERLDIRSVNKDEYQEVISLIETAYSLYNDSTFTVYKGRSMQPDGTYFCGAGVYNQICVPNGDRYICSRYQIKSGNWLKDSVEELYNKAVSWEEKVLQTPEECFDCTHKKICNGGMRCLTYAMTRQFAKKDIHCYRYEKYSN